MFADEGLSLRDIGRFYHFPALPAGCPLLAVVGLEVEIVSRSILGIVFERESLHVVDIKGKREEIE